MTQPIPLRRQRGAALLVCLIILILVTLMGLTTMRTSVLQEKISGASSDRTLALQAAELALRDAETHVKNYLDPESGFADGCEASLCRAPTDGSSAADTIDWDSAAVASYGQATAAPAIGGVATQPKYIIELMYKMQPLPGNSASMKSMGTPYRITALGYGKQQQTRVMLQSTYYKP
jgi:type IV pilus assembly protein PilX